MFASIVLLAAGGSPLTGSWTAEGRMDAVRLQSVSRPVIAELLRARTVQFVRAT